MRVCIVSAFEDSMLRDTGASVRIYNLSKALSSLNNTVDIVIPNLNPYFQKVDGVNVHAMTGFFPIMLLRAIGRLIGVIKPTALFFYDPWFINKVIKKIRSADIIQIEQISTNALLLPIIAKILKKPVVIDCHDVFQALRTKNVGTLRKVLETFLERHLYQLAKKIIVVSENEKRLLISLGLNKNNIEVVPNGVDTKNYIASLDKSKFPAKYGLLNSRIIVFVGNMEYEPNIEAVKLIDSIIAPKVQKEVEKTRFLIVGRKSNLNSPNLLFTGVVDDVAEVLSASEIAIVPLLHGSGTRLKVLEYFSCGLPVVSTSIGVEGLNIRNGVHAIIEDDLNEFGLCIIELLRNKSLAEKLGKSARNFVVENYDWAQITGHLNEIYRKM